MGNLVEMGSLRSSWTWLSVALTTHCFRLSFSTPIAVRSLHFYVDIVVIQVTVESMTCGFVQIADSDGLANHEFGD